jgi:hypothetical protein
LSLAADGDALHVDFERDPPSELIEELRRRKPEVMGALARTVIASAQSFEGPGLADEPAYEEPCPARRGVVIRFPKGRFEHFCAVCGQWGAFGYGATGNESGRWYCFAHRPDSEP